jgi:hypothetical protein
MSLIFLVTSGTRKCFVCDSGTREKKVEKDSTRQINVVTFFIFQSITLLMRQIATYIIAFLSCALNRVH